MRLGVFCGSAPGRRPSYLLAATRLGEAAAARGTGLVYGGASVGLMGALANAALGAGGEVLGVIPRALVERELAHPALTRQFIVETMHERKHKMAELADAFVALPGGFGTLDEFCEMVTWRHLGIHDKPFALLDVDGYFDLAIRFIDTAVEEGFVPARLRELMIIERDPVALLERLFPQTI